MRSAGTATLLLRENAPDLHLHLPICHSPFARSANWNAKCTHCNHQRWSMTVWRL